MHSSTVQVFLEPAAPRRGLRIIRFAAPTREAAEARLAEVLALLDAQEARYVVLGPLDPSGRPAAGSGP